MTTDISKSEGPWHHFYGPNLGYVNEQYEKYLEDPESVEAAYKDLFSKWGPPPEYTNDDLDKSSRTIQQDTDNTETKKTDWSLMKKVVAAEKLVWNIRTYGHLAADLYPLKDHSVKDTRLLEAGTYGLSDEDLESIPAEVIWEESPGEVITASDVIERLLQVYTKTLAYEFSHVYEEEERNWLNHKVETGMIHLPLSEEKKLELLQRLSEVEGFENFLHRTFVGQKRFSIEGVDMLIPMLDEIVREGILDGAHHILMGMAHRGRLNVLAHVLGKPYGSIFSEFHRAPNKDLVPSEGSMGINFGWTGDVKYHLGANRSVREGERVRTRLTLANNPSHLEFVNPVVEGFARAAQEERDHVGFPKLDVSKALAVLIHGDAAFPGEGIVAETLNLSQLAGYQTGGTIHIIANNRLGFTTESFDSRSTKYASDLAKGFEIPIVHVNADDPEACLAAIHLAYEYRTCFQKDFLVNLIGYRRYGHNEMDDPSATQPLMYSKVHDHPTVRAIYAEKLKAEGLVTDERMDDIKKQVQHKLKEAYEKVKAGEEEADLKLPEDGTDGIHPDLDTSVPLDRLREINSDLLRWPEGFKAYPKLERILKRRSHALEDGEKVDWALAETLAFATILMDGKPIRLTGQDSERGTFAHRHLILHDAVTGRTFSPLHHLPQAKASFAIHNSPLSEASVLGFEYGYNVFSPQTLVLWEAQYGDFANAAQVIFDQFLAAGRAKWSQKSSLVLLLPHGYEGQGPEHSSARLERYLQSAAENNWYVANLSSASQYFHILRRQAASTEEKTARPLIMMAPKSLIRNPRTASLAKELSSGRFHTVLEQQGLGAEPDHIERIILCSGKVSLDLAAELEPLETEGYRWLHILRVEQLYPFPKQEIERVIGGCKQLKELVWVQEEPKNMGAWSYMEPRIRSIVQSEEVTVRYIGRPEQSSPASGHPDVHNAEQKRIVSEALKQIEPIMISSSGGSSRG